MSPSVAIEAACRPQVTFFDETQAKELGRRGPAGRLMVGNNVLAQVPDLNDFRRRHET